MGVCLYVHDEGIYLGLWVETQLSPVLSSHYVGPGDQAQLSGLVARAFLFLLSHLASPSSSFPLFIFSLCKAQKTLTQDPPASAFQVLGLYARTSTHLVLFS